jgi:hypothetical protein
LRALGQQPHQGPCQGGLPASGFSKDAEHFSARQLQVGAIQGVHLVSVELAEMNVQLCNLEQWFHGIVGASSLQG